VPLDHACILTARGASNEAARKYLAFLHRAAAQKILEQFGYRVPR
jgi:ABC-type sulfate transport system substrate-binding protein